MKSLDEKLNENKTNLVEETIKQNELIQDLKSRLEEQKDISGRLSVKLDEMSKQTFTFDENTLNQILSLKTALFDVSIPEEVRVKKEVAFSDITRKVLLWFFLLSIPIVSISGYFGYTGYVETVARNQVSTSEGDFTKEQVLWLWNYVGDMKKKNPNTHNRYVTDKPFPED